MRVFLMWPDKNAELVHLMKALNSAPHKLIYWLGQTGAESMNQPGTIYHGHLDAIEGIPPKEIDISGFEPPSAELIEKLRKTESIVVTMLDRTMGGKSVGERRHFYYELLAFWTGMFRVYKPDVLIFPVEPHGAHDYIPYELARLYGIKTIFFNETRVSDRLLWMEDFRVGSNALLSRIKENHDRTFTLADLSPDIQKYYKKRAKQDKDATPGYVGYLNNKYSVTHRYSPAKVWKSIREGTIFSKTYRLFFVEKNFDLFVKPLRSLFLSLQPNLKREYRSLQKAPDMSKKFIYAALQVQPERSTSPEGDMFVDQILVVQMLAAAIPDDWVIYVKEHPIQWTRIGVSYSDSRYRGYYSVLARIPKVVLVPTETSSFGLMDRSQAVATVTGAPGWEGILRGKPALVFGHAWYKECPAVLRVHDVESCRKAIQAIVTHFTVNEGKLINYLKSLDEATIHGFIAASNAASATVDRQENIESITKLILKELA